MNMSCWYCNDAISNTASAHNSLCRECGNIACYNCTHEFPWENGVCNACNTNYCDDCGYEFYWKDGNRFWCNGKGVFLLCDICNRRKILKQLIEIGVDAHTVQCYKVFCLGMEV